MNTTSYAAAKADDIMFYRSENMIDAQDVSWYVEEEGLDGRTAAEVYTIIVTKMGF